MSARVVQVGELSKSFGVNTGVKQGCVLAPVIFNLFLVAVALVFRHNQGRTQGGVGGLGLNLPPWAWYFTKNLLPSQGD